MSSSALLNVLYEGDSPGMVELRDQLNEIAHMPGLVTVLIEGPPGTGKTTMARALAMARLFAMVDKDYHRYTIDRAVRDVHEGVLPQPPRVQTPLQTVLGGDVPVRFWRPVNRVDHIFSLWTALRKLGIYPATA